MEVSQTWENKEIKNDKDKRFMDISELADYLGLSRWTVYKLINHRRLPFIPVSKRTLRFDRLKIDQWMEKQTVKTVVECV
jgi:excisionase family DNA binding protein